MLVISSDAHRDHHPWEIHNGMLSLSSESPARADMILAALRSAGHRIERPGPVQIDAIEAVHDGDYLELLESAWPRWVTRGEEAPAASSFAWAGRELWPTSRPDDLVGQLGWHSFASDTTIVEGTWPAAIGAAAIAVSAVDGMQALGEVTYGLCRPPGHHATADRFGGYCYLNNAAIAAQRLRDAGCDRVGIIDVDYHHGNGTQSIFYDRRDVQFVSIHADPREEFPWFAGAAGERGLGDGTDANLNLPLPRGAGSADWAEALTVGIDHLTRRGIDALVVSLGVDTHVDDPLGTFRLTTADIATAGRRLADLALPTVILQEGGYASDALGANVAAFLDAFG